MVSTVQVGNLPSFISPDEFSRIFSPLNGCLSSRLLKDANSELVGFLEFRDSAMAATAISIYSGWRGWGPPGLAMTFLQPAPVLQQPLPAKREREPSELPVDPRAAKQPRPNPLAQYGAPGGYTAQPVQQHALPVSFDRGGPAAIQDPRSGSMPYGQQQGLQQPAPQQQQQQQQRPQPVSSMSLAYGMDSVPQQAPRSAPAQYGGLAGPQQQPPPQQQQQAPPQVQQSQQGYLGAPTQQPQQQQYYQPQPQQQPAFVPDSTGAYGMSAPGRFEQRPEAQQHMLGPASGVPGSDMHMGAFQQGPPLGMQDMQQPFLPEPPHYNGGPFGNGQEIPPQQQPWPAEVAPGQREGATVRKREPCNRLFIANLPADASKREVAHIMRPFDGFKALRLVPSKQPTAKRPLLCFVEFDSALAAARALEMLQGYPLDLDDPQSITLDVQFSSSGKDLQGRSSAHTKPKQPRPHAGPAVAAAQQLEPERYSPQPYIPINTAAEPPPQQQQGQQQQQQGQQQPSLLPVDPRGPQQQYALQQQPRIPQQQRRGGAGGSRRPNARPGGRGGQAARGMSMGARSDSGERRRGGGRGGGRRGGGGGGPQQRARGSSGGRGGAPARQGPPPAQQLQP